MFAVRFFLWRIHPASVLWSSCSFMNVVYLKNMVLWPTLIFFPPTERVNKMKTFYISVCEKQTASTACMAYIFFFLHTFLEARKDSTKVTVSEQQSRNTYKCHRMNAETVNPAGCFCAALWWPLGVSQMKHFWQLWGFRTVSKSISNQLGLEQKYLKY